MELESQFGSLRLGERDTALVVDGLSSFGRNLDVHGNELSAMTRGVRYPIIGWYAQARDRVASPDEVTTRQAKLDNWDTVATPALSTLPSDVVLVTTVESPSGWERQSFDLVVGGWESFLWRRMTALVNGFEVGNVAHESGSRGEPLRARIPVSGGGRGGRQVWNVVLVLEGAWSANSRLSELDSKGLLTPSMPSIWPAQFEQYVEAVPANSVAHSQLLELEMVEGSDGVGARARVNLGGRLVSLEYEWAWGGKALMRKGLVGAGPEFPVSWIDHGSWESAAVLGLGGAGEPIGLADYAVRSILHPAGWSFSTGNVSSLRQFTARGKLESLQTVCTMFSDEGAETDDVVRGLLSSLCRRVRTDPTVQTFFGVDGYGSWRYEPVSGRPYWELLDDQPDVSHLRGDIERVSKWLSAGVEVDYYSIDFLTGYAGEVGEADPERAPEGFPPLIDAVSEFETTAGIWLDTTSAGWSVGDNPKFASAYSHVEPFRTMRASLCLASEPYRSSFAAGLERLAGQGFGAIKLDNLQAHCVSPHHDHLPGVHAFEAITESAIELLRQLEENHPEILVHLYWGYRSPWWALWATTLFDPGFQTEAAHPFVFPSRSLRASTVHAVNIATIARADLPRFCKDSLGIWLSTWKWNSSQGHKDWRIAVAFDLVRANRFPQLWTGEVPFSSEDLKWLSMIQSLYQQQPNMFDVSYEFGSFGTSDAAPYGLACSSIDRRLGLVGFHNPSWDDSEIRLPSALEDAVGADIGVLAGSGVRPGETRGSFILEAQSMCVVAFGFGQVGHPSLPHSPGVVGRSRHVWGEKVTSSELTQHFGMPNIRLSSDEQVALTIQLFDHKGKRLTVDRIDQLVGVQGVPESRWSTVVGNALPSSWQVLLLDGPDNFSDWQINILGDLLGASSADANLVILPKQTH